MVQPLFREVLDHYDPTDPEAPNLYAFFRAFWYRLPAEVHTAMRLRILADADASTDPAHPPLPDRLALLQAYPDPRSHEPHGDSTPATAVPRRPGRLRADAPQPPLRPAARRAERLPPRGDVRPSGAACSWKVRVGSLIANGMNRRQMWPA